MGWWEQTSAITKRVNNPTYTLMVSRLTDHKEANNPSHSERPCPFQQLGDTSPQNSRTPPLEEETPRNPREHLWSWCRVSSRTKGRPFEQSWTHRVWMPHSVPTRSDSVQKGPKQWYLAQSKLCPVEQSWSRGVRSPLESHNKA